MNHFHQLTIFYACGCVRLRFVSERMAELLDPTAQEEVSSPFYCPECEASNKRKKEYRALVALHQAWYEQEGGAA